VAEQIALKVSGTTMSGLHAGPESGGARATIVALHGGGYTSAYWDGPVDGRSSLLGLGARLGFSVLALDRPGYGASRGLARDEQDVAHQARLLGELLDGLDDRLAAPRPVFLVGHSLGAILALRMAADAGARADTPIAGVALSGLPVEYPASMAAAMAATLPDLDHLPLFPREHRRALFYGPEGTWPPEALEWDVTAQALCPVAEFRDAGAYPSTFPTVAAEVRVPVQYALAEFEASSVGGPDVLARSAAAFVAAPRVEAFIQPATGHNISVHRVARAYHLRVLAFAEDCLAQRPLTEPSHRVRAHTSR
jgi:pimeloyl-ACP methyl ester carboxylesterase